MGWMTRGAGRLYFLLQAVAGTVWWSAVALVPPVREATLGGLDPVPVAIADIPLFVGGSAVAAAGLRGAAWATTGWATLVALALALYATVTGLAGWGVVLMAAASAASFVASLLIVHGRLPIEWLMRGPFRIRPARPGSRPRAHLASTGLQIVVFWGLGLGVVPVIVAWFEGRWMLSAPVPGAVPLSGFALFVGASALGLWAAVSMSSFGDGTPLPMATARRLVVRGPYRFVRNPMAVAGIAQGVAVGLMLSSWLVVLYAVCGSVVWNALIRPQEEADLENRFGAQFRRYRAEVRCWIPRLRPVAPSIAVRIAADAAP